MLEELSSLASKPKPFASLNTENFVSEFEKNKRKKSKTKKMKSDIQKDG